MVSLAMAIWTLGYIFELISPTLEAKIFWDNMQWITSFIIPLAMLAFAIQYTGRKLRHPRWVWGVLILISVIFLVLIFTDRFHGLLRPTAWLVPGQPFDALVYDLNSTVWITMLYVYALTLAALYLLLDHFRRSNIYRTQVGVVLLGAMFPLIGTFLSLIGIIPTFQRDTTPFTFAIFNLLIMWGLFQFHLFDVVPQARSTVIENIPDAVFVLDAQGRVVDLNPAAQQIIGPMQSSVIGLSAWQVFGQWPDLVEQFSGTKEVHTEIVIDGFKTQQFFDLTISSIYDRRGRFTGRAVVVRNITAQKEVEVELRQYHNHLEELVKARTAELMAANEKLRQEITEREQVEEQFRQSQKMEAVGRLAGGIAHDFNNLLTVISGYSELLLHRHVDLQECCYKNIQQIIKAAEQAASLTQQLLIFSRKQVVQPQIVNLNSIVTDTEKMLQRLIGEDIDFATIAKQDTASIKVDPGQMQQVILNLAVNARDAMPLGGRLTIETANVDLDEVYARQHLDLEPGPYVMLAVTDTGIGMDKKTQSQIFEPFFTTKGRGEGTGLGLATVYGIIKQSEGSIHVYSEPGHGTTFKIYLPRVQDEISVTSQETNQADLPLGCETILLVEDDEAVRNLAQVILNECGYTVHPAGQADEALEVCRENGHMIDLLITDIVIPGGKNGRELVEEITPLYPGIKTLYMSGYTTDAMVRHGILEAEVAYLQKPFSPVALARKTREVLDTA
jgi:PAS domain S-box-containing protein